MDAARAMPGGKRDLAASIPGTDLPAGAEALPLHPHNAALQWRLELGVPGTLLALAAVLWPLWRAAVNRALTRRQRAASLAFAASALVVALISYGIWQAWWVSCLWLTGAFIAGAARGQNAA
jgi:O-antigen ligase